MALLNQQQAQIQAEPRQMKKKRLPQIIIVDDDLTLLDELKDVLSSHYRVETIADSSKAFDRVYELRPDLILLDIKMSPKTGFQLAHEFRNFEGTKYIPIIAITGVYIEKEHSLMMKLSGMKHIIIKPFNFDQLFDEIEYVLKGFRSNWH